MDRFKGLDLLECLETEVYNIIQEAEIKNSPKRKKSKKTKWLFGEALQIVVKRREVKRKDTPIRMQSSKE